ncbi:Pls/PosA family non-ribosomal peptide synthetase [Streptomyces silvisoli]|uniref:Amino acid adenylation domain-containing protein n=1 Tax=Streptomyces silvisoli TaxID=3034235 RepID=A0ABT5ZE66_9ACTN|nr:Pls/PosA family non-ribosomal peptide synthetase [Streptomyces silvisoli]MDF3287961.1 amino acid adenylation domain-containing protein [Streptomyces silvisoli]
MGDDPGAVTATRPRALPPTRGLIQFFERACDRTPENTALVCGDTQLSYAELDRRANRLARLLRQRGAGEGRAVGILLDRSVDTYVALLGVMKAGAAYVPLDPSFPAARVAFIAQDAELCDLVTSSTMSHRTQGLPCPVLELDKCAEELDGQSAERPAGGVSPSSLCYVIYTSGTTGRPKGVAVSHANIVNFLRVVTPIYRVNGDDRVYQGLSIAFDFSVEEIWPAWSAGATLVAGPTDDRRVGQGLADFLVENAITVLCCVPTLLTTIEGEVPSLRSLLVSGEACPPDLVRRWHRPGRRILNAYGPTESTVTATCGELHPHRPVTIGTPLPTYRVYILNDRMRPVAEGESGEICVGGPGVAIGYLNRPELTAERFVTNPVEHERAEHPRIYRTGDLGRFTSTGEIEYLGRIDTQVKIRGYRIELAEIEEVLREDEAVENAVVTPLERDGVVQDLVGYVTLTGRTGGESHDRLRERLHTALRRRLPEYMIPSFVEVLPQFPLLAADKVDRAALPAPASPPLARGSRPHVAAATALESQLAAVWREVLGAEKVSVEDDFFCDLGGHSMAAARLVSRLRRQPELATVAMADLYAHPTIRDLATHLDTGDQAPDEQPSAEPAPPVRHHSSARVALCGIAQIGSLYAWLLLAGLPLGVLVYRLLAVWHEPVRAVAPHSALNWLSHLGFGAFIPLEIGWLLVSLLVLPLLVGRLLMAGVRPGWYPLWGVTYLRFWLYGKVLALSPIALLTGSPLLPPMLRLLGARIGRGCHLSSVVALPCFLRLGDDVSVGYGARLLPFLVEDGWLRLAPVALGDRSYVGTNSVVMPGATLGSGASVGDQSLVPADRTVPADEHWSGSPARRQDARPALLDAMAADADDRRWPLRLLAGYALGSLLLILVPLVIADTTGTLVGYVTVRDGLFWGCLSTLAVGPLVVVLTCLLVLVLKRALLPRVRAGVHPERSGFGVRKWIGDGLMNTSLVLTHALYSTLYLVPFLRWLGARTGRWSEVATVSFVDPDMLVIGERSFVADVSVVGPAVFHRGRIALAPAEVGKRSFVGNGALVPGSCRMGDNSLLGVHSVAPTRPVDPETTWLGSPAIFLPRREESQNFPAKYTYDPSPGLIAARLVIEYFRVTLPGTFAALGVLLSLYAAIGLAKSASPTALFLLGPALLLGVGVLATLLTVVLKWLVIGRYRPRVEPLWGIWVRRTELITGLFENLVVPSLVNFLTGTPLMGTVMRLFGARIGRRVWLSTTYMTEFDLVEVGDDAAVGEVTSLQTHLFEDRVMKMSNVRVGKASSVGPRTVVLYDAEVGAGTSLDALSLLMKGERLPDRTRWRGIPARPC